MSEPDHIYSISEVTFLLKDLVETTFPSVWVAGEISDFARPRSGHCYLTLKDDRCQMRAVIWKGTAARLKFDVEDGLEVVCRGHIDVYAPRGSYQLIVEEIQPRGVGALELALRKLREKLASEGLFEPARKKRLPAFARRVGVVTSPTGAAVRDFLEVLRRRWRGVDVLVAPTRVQGEGAAAEIAAAIADLNRMPSDIDCIVVTRGGGSLEDLWAFNEEPVVRAVAASHIPVISAIGHEIDVTLTDLAADVRAATPSEAAELVAPTADEISASLGHLGARLVSALRHNASNAKRRLDGVINARAFRRPHDLVADRARRIDELDARLTRSLGHRQNLAQTRLDAM
ncbi:MAG: exodeoxyribonuclease VII large subunit, partial [Pirellulales bacterium]|nr:exodeoxyribonuclease VII large subunit [Pirellulales bacterium]